MLNFSNDFYKTIKKYKYKNSLLIKNKIMGIINKKEADFLWQFMLRNGGFLYGKKN